MTTDNATNKKLISGIDVWSLYKEVMKVGNCIFWFAFGFVMGNLFWMIIKLVKKCLYRRSERLKNKILW